MENMGSRERYVVVTIAALAIVTAMALSRGLDWFWITMEWNDLPIIGSDFTLTSLLAYGISAGVAALCLKHETIYPLLVEVVDELAKVVWPSRQETEHATVVVVVTVLICSAFLGVFDAVWLWVTDWLLGIEATPS
jgi:preprotein translocase SecE subunit